MRSNMKNFKESNNITKVMIGVCIAAIIYLWGRDLLRMISYEIPNEIRQGANVALTEAFARGENPYRMMTNGNGEPMVFYMYPFLHSLIGAGIVKLTSLPATLVLLGLNSLYITATAVLISKITYCYTKEPYTVILAFC